MTTEESPNQGGMVLDLKAVQKPGAPSATHARDAVLQTMDQFEERSRNVAAISYILDSHTRRARKRERIAAALISIATYIIAALMFWAS